MHRYSYYKTAACTLNVSIGDPQANKEEILKCIQELDSDTQLVVFPELCITGYTCQDLFYEHTLLNNPLSGTFDIFGHSHQIFHVMVVIAAFCHWKGLVQSYHYLHLQTLPNL